ncbi:MAG TPA: site-2 protease family protein [Anaeromyxobacteraceae bacterium]|nr:site-2 protease family protein [Anaeromyxobacteraceae bacterium]
MDNAVLLERVTYLILLVLSLTVHEFSHAWTAWRLGDDTAALAGRLTLNPIPHIDPIGTLILPLLGVPFGWAKPVPVNPARFRRDVKMSTGDILTSAAGPISNLLLALLAAVVLGIVARFAPGVVRNGSGAFELLRGLMFVNAALMIFNLLPIPPLDGGHVAANLVPYRFRDAWESFARIAPFVLLAVIFFGRSIISAPIQFIVAGLWQIAVVVAG